MSISRRGPANERKLATRVRVPGTGRAFESPDEEVPCSETLDLRNCPAFHKGCQATQVVREARSFSFPAGFRELALAIPFQVIRIVVPPFFLTVSALLAIHRVGCELPTMVVSAPLTLALDGTARSLFRVVEVRAECILAVNADFFRHCVC